MDSEQIICHCVSTNCKDCPMRNTGTAGIQTERKYSDGRSAEEVSKIDAGAPEK